MICVTLMQLGPGSIPSCVNGSGANPFRGKKQWNTSFIWHMGLKHCIPVTMMPCEIWSRVKMQTPVA